MTRSLFLLPPVVEYDNGVPTTARTQPRDAVGHSKE
jgi:hypothetical protein